MFKLADVVLVGESKKCRYFPSGARRSKTETILYKIEGRLRYPIEAISATSL